VPRFCLVLRSQGAMIRLLVSSSIERGSRFR
jgi:hypothetical protein